MNKLKFYPFPSIEQFRQVVSSVKRSDDYNNKDSDNTTLTFQGTVKLHGTNAGIITHNLVIMSYLLIKITLDLLPMPYNLKSRALLVIY